MNEPDAVKLVQRIADEFPWHDEQTFSVCSYCRRTWTHEEDCVWLAARRLLGMKEQD